jgi:hypothetical protein
MKTAKTILASSVFLGMVFGTAHAEICWKLTPFADVIRATQISDRATCLRRAISEAPIRSYLATGFLTLPIRFHSWEL